MSKSLRNQAQSPDDDLDDPALLAIARGPAFEDYDDATPEKLDPVPEYGSELKSHDSLAQRLRRGASNLVQRARVPYETLDAPAYGQAGFPQPSSTAVPPGTGNVGTSRMASLAAMAQRQFVQDEGVVYPDDPRLLALMQSFTSTYGPMPATLHETLQAMPDRGICIMETWLAENAPNALPDEPVSSLARMPTQSATGASGLLPAPSRFAEGLTGTKSSGLQRAHTLTTGNTLNTQNDRALADMGSDRQYGQMATMVRDVLRINLELAKHLRAEQEYRAAQGKDTDDGEQDLFKDLPMSPSLKAVIDHMHNRDEYKGDDIQPFYAEPGWDPKDAEEKTEQLPNRLRKAVRIDWLALIVAILFYGACGFYFTWRILFTLTGLGKYLPYGLAILAVEGLGALAIIPYAFSIIWYVKKEEPQPVTKLNYHVRVLVPCYREPLSVVGKTIAAALTAPVPYGCYKTVYLCDDGKEIEKKNFIHGLAAQGNSVVYVSGRKRGKKEINGKSCNINNITSLLYPCADGDKKGNNVPWTEVIALFDSDMECKPDFFMKTLPLMDGGKDVAMVLTPQFFFNAQPHSDIFNHFNIPFWHYTQVGYDALDIISCTGTNFLVRARAFMSVGQFPDYTLTEDFALGIRLKAGGWRCRYVEEYLAVGEAPNGVRNCFQQRSRWSKGHFQLFFSRYCPLLEVSWLGLFARLMYSSVLVNYFAAFICTPVLMAVPMVTIWVGVFPLIVNEQAALAITVYYCVTTLTVFYVRTFTHLPAMYFAIVSNTVLWFAYLKALWRATIGGLFSGLVFKVTAKGAGFLAASGIQDTWIHVVSFCALVTTFVIACIQLASGPASSPLVISMCWLVYAMIPEFLLLYYWTFHNWFSRRVLKYLCFFGRYLSLIVGILGIVLIWPLLPNKYGDYSQATAVTTQFQGSQYSGAYDDAARAAFPQVTWRGDAMMQDNAVPVVNASYIGNYTDWLINSGYFDDKLPVDLSAQLDDLSLEAARQQSLLSTLTSGQTATAQTMQQLLDRMSSNDPANKEPSQLANEAATARASITSLNRQLEQTSRSVAQATERATTLSRAVTELQEDIQTADQKLLPLDRVSRDRIMKRLTTMKTALDAQQTVLAGLTTSLQATTTSLQQAATDAQALQTQSGSAPSNELPAAPTGRRRILQQEDAPAAPAKEVPAAPAEVEPPAAPAKAALTPEEEQIRQNTIEQQEAARQDRQRQQDLLRQQAERRAANEQLRTAQATVATSLRAALDAFTSNSADLTTMAAEMEDLTSTLSKTALSLADLPTQPAEYSIKLQDMISGSLWAPSRYLNETLLKAYDLQGGFITNFGASNLKATAPIAFSTAMLAFTLLEYSDNIKGNIDLQNDEEVDAIRALETAVRHGAEYLLKVYLEDKQVELISGTGAEAVNGPERSFSAIISRVGFPQREGLFHTRPEDAEAVGRTAFAIDQAQGATDIAGLVVGGLAAAATYFQESGKDQSFAASCRDTAVKVFRFGANEIASSTDTDVDLAMLYNSTSVLDDLAWGAAWMYRATNDTIWLGNFTQYAALHLRLETERAELYAFNVDQTFWGSNMVVAGSKQIDTRLLPMLLNNTETMLKRWMCGGTDQIANSTKRGLALHPNYTTTGTTQNAAFLSTLLSTEKYKALIKGSKQEAFECWGMAQVRYVLGDGGRSLLAGFGEEPPTYAQDAGIACQNGTTPCDTFTAFFSTRDTKATLDPEARGGTAPPLLGAMVSGPDLISDKVEAERPLNSSRVGIENNAGITGALAGLSRTPQADARWQRCQQISGAVRIHPVCGTRFVL